MEGDEKWIRKKRRREKHKMEERERRSGIKREISKKTKKWEELNRVEEKSEEVRKGKI